MDKAFEILRKYNYWDTESINPGFVRNLYLNRISKFIGNNLAKVLVGQRRTGKSYLLRQIMDKLIRDGVNKKNILYLNKELVDFDVVETYKDVDALIKFYKTKQKVKGKIYVFIDEVQEIEGWEKVVNSLSQNHKQQYEVFITGSNSQMLSSELGTYLSGRFVTFDIFPYSFNEYSELNKVKKNKDNFVSYLKSGGMPELYNLDDYEAKLNYISSLKDTILLNDIVKKFSIKDVYLLETLFRFTIDNIGNMFSINKVVNFMNTHRFNTNHETVSNYISYLCRSILVHEAAKYDIKGKVILSGAKKYYLNDLSFRNYLTSGFDIGLGRQLENIVYLALKTAGYKVFVGSMQNLEVDFIAEKNGVKKYFQVSYSLSDASVYEREYKSLMQINDNYEKSIITMDDSSFGDKDGIKHVPVWEFLTE